MILPVPKGMRWGRQGTCILIKENRAESNSP